MSGNSFDYHVGPQISLAVRLSGSSYIWILFLKSTFILFLVSKTFVQLLIIGYMRCLMNTDVSIQVVKGHLLV